MNPEVNHNIFTKNEKIEKPTTCELVVHDGTLDILLQEVKLSDEGEKKLGTLVVDVEKQPIDIPKSGIIGMIKFENETEATKELERLAEELSSIESEKERIDALLALLKSKITYGYSEIIEQKAQERGVPVEFMNRMGVQGNEQIGFDEVVKYGVGVCGHLSAAYLHLANKAGLKGILVNSAPERTPLNIMRTDKEKKLFRSADVGSRTSNHAWVEIQTQDGLGYQLTHQPNLLELLWKG